MDIDYDKLPSKKGKVNDRVAIDFFGRRIYGTTNYLDRGTPTPSHSGIETVFTALSSKTWALVVVDGQPRMRGELNGEPNCDIEKVVAHSSGPFTVDYVLIFGWSSIRNAAVVEKVNNSGKFLEGGDLTADGQIPDCVTLTAHSS